MGGREGEESSLEAEEFLEVKEMSFLGTKEQEVKVQMMLT